MNKNITIVLVHHNITDWNPLVERLEFEGFKNVIPCEWAEEALKALPTDAPSILITESLIKHHRTDRSYAAGARFLGKELKKFPLCKSILCPINENTIEHKIYFNAFIPALGKNSLRELVKTIKEFSSIKTAT